MLNARLLRGGAAAVASLSAGSLILFGAVLPAEFNLDPLGLGRLTGLSRLWAPNDTTFAADSGPIPRAREYEVPFRSDVVRIALGSVGGGVGPYALEYKVRMQKGATLAYAWEAVGASDPAAINFDFHGHTLPAGKTQAMVVASYRKAAGIRQSGSLVAPFDGIHGWYLDNRTDTPVVIQLRLSGFYELVPPGEPGNESGITATASPAKGLL